MQEPRASGLFSMHPLVLMLALIVAVLLVLLIANSIHNSHAASYDEVAAKIDASPAACRLVIKQEITQILLTTKKPISRGDLQSLGDTEKTCEQIAAQLNAAARH